MKLFKVVSMALLSIFIFYFFEVVGSWLVVVLNNCMYSSFFIYLSVYLKISSAQTKFLPQYESPGLIFSAGSNTNQMHVLCLK